MWMRFGRHLEYHTLGKYFFQVSRKLEISTTHVQNGLVSQSLRAVHACQVWHSSSTKVLFVCNKEGHGRKVKEGNATAESDDSNYEEGGSEPENNNKEYGDEDVEKKKMVLRSAEKIVLWGGLYKLTVGVLLSASVILALWQMGVERLQGKKGEQF